MTTGTPDGGVGLADAIEQVRRELETAIEKGASSSVAFRAGPIQLDFAIEFSSTLGGDAGVRVWVASFGAKGERTQTTTHRLSVTLQAVDRATGQDQLIGSESER